ncbi:MAGE-domain-containing protein [Exidia glandulosa HHB12029]|uniref:MAGE-domain-containing protein n=1 Tax=Exidia glandulosa HHB12029 TaxID=1314781 RepID=A0A165Q6W7_EXIGL|nr:MAGE-domain-containing protein [Exidia glandulosa HHB12029]
MPRASQKTYSKRRQRPNDDDDDEEVPDDAASSEEEQERKPRRGKASQSQSASQSQRRRRETPEDDDNEDAEEAGESGTTETKAYALVRLALAAEYKRTVLKRDDINKKGKSSLTSSLKGDSRSFKEVLERAQGVLRKTFGYELYELKSRTERDRILSKAPEDNDKKDAGSKQYVLRSVLEPELVALAAAPDRELAGIEGAERAEEEGREENELPPDGSILALTDRDPLGAHALGVLHVVLALILVSGRLINEVQLRNLLKKLRITQNAHIPFPPSATAQSMTLDNWLNAMVRQGYLDRQVSQVGVPATQGKRGRVRTRPTQNQDEDSNEIVELRWGERAHAEMREEAVAQWVVDFMFDPALDVNAAGDDSDDDEGGGGGAAGARKRKEQKEKRAKAVEGMMKDIRRAAGGLDDD